MQKTNNDIRDEILTDAIREYIKAEQKIAEQRKTIIGLTAVMIIAIFTNVIICLI